MQPLPYTVIKSPQDYDSYKSVLDFLSDTKKKTKDITETIELLTLLTQKWEEDQSKKLPKTNPVALLIHLMKINQLSQTELATELGVGKALVSDILNYRRAISKNIIRKLSKRFAVPEELFSKPYQLGD